MRRKIISVALIVLGVLVLRDKLLIVALGGYALKVCFDIASFKHYSQTLIDLAIQAWHATASENEEEQARERYILILGFVLIDVHNYGILTAYLIIVQQGMVANPLNTPILEGIPLTITHISWALVTITTFGEHTISKQLIRFYTLLDTDPTITACSKEVIELAGTEVKPNHFRTMLAIALIIHIAMAFYYL